MLALDIELLITDDSEVGCLRPYGRAIDSGLATCFGNELYEHTGSKYLRKGGGRLLS